MKVKMFYEIFLSDLPLYYFIILLNLSKMRKNVYVSIYFDKNFPIDI